MLKPKYNIMEPKYSITFNFVRQVICTFALLYCDKMVGSRNFLQVTKHF